jgi:iron complex transport system substrate-binding protein
MLPALTPQRIVCLSEETTEWLYMLGQEHRIVGISGNTVRPHRAMLEKPKVSSFLNVRVEKILELKPYCVFGYSDLQADIAAQLIRSGVQVTIFNQRSIEEIFSALYQIATMVGQASQGEELIKKMRAGIDDAKQKASLLRRRPLVLFEEWDDPLISGIQWVSELLEIAGGVDFFAEMDNQPLGKDRINAYPAEVVRRKPDLIIGSWCGKNFKAKKLALRDGSQSIPAVQDCDLCEIELSDILQPGPAALTDGLRQLSQIIHAWGVRHAAYSN